MAQYTTSSTSIIDDSDNSGISADVQAALSAVLGSFTAVERVGIETDDPTSIGASEAATSDALHLVAGTNIGTGETGVAADPGTPVIIYGDDDPQTGLDITPNDDPTTPTTRGFLHRTVVQKQDDPLTEPDESVDANGNPVYEFSEDEINPLRAPNTQVVLSQPGARIVVTNEGDDMVDASAPGITATIETGVGQDTIITGAGDDFINPGEHADSVSAGAGNDTIITGQGSQDTIDGGPGIDVVYVRTAGTPTSGEPYAIRLGEEAEIGGSQIIGEPQYTVRDVTHRFKDVEYIVLPEGDGRILYASDSREDVAIARAVQTMTEHDLTVQELIDLQAQVDSTDLDIVGAIELIIPRAIESGVLVPGTDGVDASGTVTNATAFVNWAYNTFLGRNPDMNVQDIIDAGTYSDQIDALRQVAGNEQSSDMTLLLEHLGAATTTDVVPGGTYYVDALNGVLDLDEDGNADPAWTPAQVIADLTSLQPD